MLATAQVDPAAFRWEAYDAVNRVEHVKDSSGTSTFTFDADGNQELVEHPGGTVTTNTWDYENRLIRVQLPSGARVTAAYDADGVRVSKDI